MTYNIDLFIIIVIIVRKFNRNKEHVGFSLFPNVKSYLYCVFLCSRLHIVHTHLHTKVVYIIQKKSFCPFLHIYYNNLIVWRKWFAHGVRSILLLRLRSYCVCSLCFSYFVISELTATSKPTDMHIYLLVRIRGTYKKLRVLFLSEYFDNSGYRSKTCISYLSHHQT